GRAGASSAGGVAKAARTGYFYEGAQVGERAFHCASSRTACADCHPLSRRRLALTVVASEYEIDMSTYVLGNRTVNRLGYGAMQLAGPGVFGPPEGPEAALGVLRTAVANGVNHIDTSDFYGPHHTNRIIRKALHPYPDDLVIVTKIGALRGA